jgi:hypothetical protein
MTLTEVNNLVRALVDDQRGSFATPEYILPFAKLAMGELSKGALENPNLGQLYATVILPNKPNGATDFKSDFVVGGQLELMSDVVSVKERSTGGTRSEQDWMWMDRVQDIPSFNQGAFNSYFAWRGDNILIPGCNQAMDFRVFGKFLPKPFTGPDSPIIPGVQEILAYRAAGVIAASRSNPGMADRWEGKANILTDEFFNNAIMEMQNLRTRNRAYSSRGILR